uniref:Aminopeptidase N-like N-terminal domain-containing protein n=1 Tax=Cacopsylla melanoneura TaxID=428564 RepID=A0A8D8V5Z4_9HEMI
MSLMKVSLLLGMASIGLTIAVVFLCYSLYTSTCETNDDASSTSSPLMSSTLPASKTVWEKDFRLSPHIIPDLYEVKLHPDLVTGLFTCEEKISVRVLSRVDYIYLHIDRLNVSKSVVKQNGVSIPIKAAFSYPKHQYWVVTLERSLEVGECTLEFMADGNLRKQDIVGFYSLSTNIIYNSHIIYPQVINNYSPGI